MDKFLKGANHEEPKNVHDHGKICDEIKVLYANKNHDYGGAIEKAVNELGWVYISAMLYNKLQRFMNLSTKHQSIHRVDEKLEDTLVDMANYAIEGARLLRERRAKNEFQETKGIFK